MNSITVALTSSQKTSDNERLTYSDWCSVLHISTKCARRANTDPAFANTDVPAHLCCHRETLFMTTGLF